MCNITFFNIMAGARTEENLIELQAIRLFFYPTYPSTTLGQVVGGLLKFFDRGRWFLENSRSEVAYLLKQQKKY